MQSFKTPSAEIRAQVFQSSSVGRDNSKDDYYKFLQQQGLELNPSMLPSIFRLKNGLEYSGFAAKESINGNEILLRIPEKLVLTSVKALQQPALQQVYKHKFFTQKTKTKDPYKNWECKVITVYCIYLMIQKNDSNPWYQMIKKFPNQCDIACFWPQEQLNLFKDPSVKIDSLLKLQQFENEYKQFEQCKKCYEILQHPEFSKESYQMMFTHLQNRSFRKYVKFLSHVPFAEFINHHCSKTYYDTEEKAQTYFRKAENEQAKSECSSDESEYSDQEFDFKLDDFNCSPEVSKDQGSEGKRKKEKEILSKKAEDIFKQIRAKLNREDCTVVADFLIKQINAVSSSYSLTTLPFEDALQRLEQIQKNLISFSAIVQTYHKNKKKRQLYKFKETIEANQQGSFKYPKYEKDYESFVIKTGPGDFFQANNQVFFRYGRDSNKSLLHSYGFALEGNKYEKVEIALRFSGPLEPIHEKLIKKGQKLRRKIQVKGHRLNMDLILFLRLNSQDFEDSPNFDELFTLKSLQKEKRVIHDAIDVLKCNLEVFSGDEDLTDKSLSYHRYFIAVYHLEKCRILRLQLAYLHTILHILTELETGNQFGELFSKISQRDQYVLRIYFHALLTKK